jgi:hypothetical protein
VAQLYQYSITADITSQQCDMPRLIQEIQNSSITTALDDMTITDDNLDINFKAMLSGGDETTLDALVLAHSGVILDQGNPVNLNHPTTDDDIPLMYTTAKPQDHYTCFLGSSDGTKIGKGGKCIFKLASTDESKYLDFTFDEDIYIKDGCMHVVDAPLGATVDVDVILISSGDTIGTFGRNIPILGSGCFPLNTTDRSLIATTDKLRITVTNADGTGDEDAAADFTVAGRFETYRPNWTGVNL